MKDGGNAFPAVYYEETWRALSGMSLRDWFAGMALQGLCASHQQAADAAPTAVPIAEDAYKLADAMIAEREKP